MFDKSGTNFTTVTEPYKESLSELGIEIRNDLIETWIKNEKPISKLRHNIGFHGGTKVKSHDVGYGALLDIHPQTPEYIMNQMALFFIELDKAVPPSQDLSEHINTDEAKEFLINRSKELKVELEDDSMNDLMRKFLSSL